MLIALKRFALLAAPLLALTHAVPVQAQEGRPPGEGRSTLFSLEFDGGSLGAFASAVREVHDGATFVVDEIAASFTLPSMQLQQIDLVTAASLAEVIASPPEGRNGQVHVHTWRVGESGRHAVAIRGRFLPREDSAAAEETRIWSLAEHLNNGTHADDLLAGAEAAMGAVGLGGALRFHPPTAMLIARGSPEQIDAVDQAVRQMHLLGSRSQSQEEELRSQIATSEELLSQATAQLRIAVKRVEVAQLGVESARESSFTDAGALGREAVAKAEMKVVEAQAELERIQSEVERRRRHLERMRARLDALDD